MKHKKVVSGFIAIFILIQLACSNKTIQGTWQYDGGIYNGKAQSASPDFKMQRSYTANMYEAFMTDGDTRPEKYASGKFEIKGDSLLLTSEYSSQPSQLVGKTIVYKLKLDKDKLTIKGTLPNGMLVEEYWKRVK